jgi:hypothetical protein
MKRPTGRVASAARPRHRVASAARPLGMVAWALLAAGGSLAPAPARADMRREGEWPADEDERVTLSIEGPRAEALRRLAEAAGWNVIAIGAQTDPVSIQVKDQPAAKVLELLLSDGSYVAKREGQVIAIAPQAGAATPAAPAPQPMAAEPEKSEPPQRGKDRVITGSSAVVRPDEVVGNLTVLGGSAEVYGTVTDDIAVFGGSLEVHDGAHVYGDVAILGGSAEIAKGAQVDGDVSSLGGSVEREDAAGSAGAAKHGGPADRAGHGDRDDHDDESDESEPKGSQLGRLARQLSGALAATAMLFAFGTVLLTLAAPRMEVLQREIEARPMRSVALGVVALVAGAIALVALCATLIGIPVAIVAVLLGTLGVYAGICAALTVLGATLLRGRTTSPYAHLALGCGLYLVAGAIPVVGWCVTVAAVLLGLGVLVSTRAAGLLKRRDQPPTAGALSSSV